MKILRETVVRRTDQPKMEGFTMDFGRFQFGSIKIDGVSYKHDVLSTGGKIRQRRKKPSKKFREEFGHIPVSVEEEIPWKCQRLIVGTGRYDRFR